MAAGGCRHFAVQGVVTVFFGSPEGANRIWGSCLGLAAVLPHREHRARGGRGEEKAGAARDWGLWLLERDAVGNEASIRLDGRRLGISCHLGVFGALCVSRERRTGAGGANDLMDPGLLAQAPCRAESGGGVFGEADFRAGAPASADRLQRIDFSAARAADWPLIHAPATVPANPMWQASPANIRWPSATGSANASRAMAAPGTA
jgi:hypothetical protein